MDELKKVRDGLEEAYTLLQSLGIQPTKSNMSILLAVLDAMQAAHEYLGRARIVEDAAPEEAEG